MYFIFVAYKGLKEICVRSADDAVRVLLFGKENLHFAATKLNHNSSRSHCVFTVKLIRTNHCDEPTEAAISMMSFVDLAGMERTTKTQSKGERLKEAGNINTSLLILGRCIDAMRSNQQNSSNKAMIPYRESKLTRILQHFFSGMILFNPKLVQEPKFFFLRPRTCCHVCKCQSVRFTV